MGKYRIKYNYNTGDSFGQTPNQEGYLDVTWDNLDIAKENIKRIIEHYKAYRNVESYISKKEWSDYKNERWFLNKGKNVNSENYLKLLTDNGNEYTESTYSWTGYFESLNYVEIVDNKDNNDLKIYV